MSSGSRLRLVAGMLLATTLASALPRAAGAGELSPAGDAARDTVATRAPPVARGAPSPAELEILRERVDHHVARLRLGDDLYDVYGATFDARGVAFAPGRLRGIPNWQSLARTDAFARPGELASPVRWERIDAVTVRKPCGTRGAITGGVIGAAAYVGILAFLASSGGGEDDMAGLVLLPLPPLGALIGGGIGAMIRRTEPGWQRSGGIRPEIAGSPALAPEPSLPRAPTRAGSSPAMLGILRADLERYPVRLWLGRDVYEVRRARLDPAGVAFDPGELQALAASAPRVARLRPPESPIEWDRIDRIESRRPSGRQGAILGMIAASVAGLALNSMAQENRSVMTAGGVVLVFGSAGALVGAGLGSLVTHSEVEWERSVWPPARR